MTHKLLPKLISALILSACQSALPPDNTTPVATAAPHNLILYYHGDHADSALRQHIAAYGAEILYHYPILHGFAIRIPADKSLNDAEATSADCQTLAAYCATKPNSCNKHRTAPPQTALPCPATAASQSIKLRTVGAKPRFL